MQATEIRTRSTEEIHQLIDQAYQSLFRLRFDWAAGQLDDNNRIREVKKDIARLKTILREREIVAEIEASRDEALSDEPEALR